MIKGEKMEKHRKARSFYSVEWTAHGVAILRKKLRGVTCSPLLFPPRLLLKRGPDYTPELFIHFGHMYHAARKRSCSFTLPSQLSETCFLSDLRSRLE